MPIVLWRAKWRTFFANGEGGGRVGDAAGAPVEIECIGGEIKPCFWEGVG